MYLNEPPNQLYSHPLGNFSLARHQTIFSW